MEHSPKGLKGSTPEPSSEELAIVGLLARGHTDDVVASRLGLSKRTYRRRLDKVMEKLGATSRFEAGVLAAQQGWLQSTTESAGATAGFWPPSLKGPAHRQEEIDTHGLTTIDAMRDKKTTAIEEEEES